MIWCQEDTEKNHCNKRKSTKSTLSIDCVFDVLWKFYFIFSFCIYFLSFYFILFVSDIEFKHSYGLAADVMHREFIANANSQLQSPVGLFHSVAVQY